MMSKFYPLKALVILLLFWSIGPGVNAQTMTLSKSVYNSTTGGDGSTASQGDVLVYTLTMTNSSNKSFTTTKLYDNIPTGTSYVTASTKLNGTGVSDVSGAMPYANGGLINSSGASAGTVASGKTVTVVFSVQVTANAGSIKNYFTVDGTYQSVSYVNQSNTVFTNLIQDPLCSTMFQSTPSTVNNSTSSQYVVIRDFDTTTGKVVTTPYYYYGPSGLCYNANTGAAVASGSILTTANGGTAAIAYDKTKNRLYFVCNNTSSPPLSYIDLANPVGGVLAAYAYYGYPLETTTCGQCNVNRMCFSSDGYGYALTSGATDLIKFYVDASNVPQISRLGALTNDTNNGTNDVTTEVGGDIFGDGSGRLYLIANSSKIYKINTSTRVATYMGAATPSPGTSQSICIDGSGNVFIGGAYQNVYKLDLSNMNISSITGGSTSNVYYSGDYSSCSFPVLSANIVANKSYKNINGSSTVVGGDTVVYTITISNTGNFNAANVKLYDYIPTSTHYLAGTTTLNGAGVPDVSGVMPYAVTGGAYVNSPGESAGIVKAGTANAATVTFNVVTDPLKTICNQSKITLVDGDGNLIFVNSSNPDSSSQTPTCFFSDELLASNDLKFKGALNNGQSVLTWSMSNDENVAYYEIEYSETGNSFASIGQVAGKGNTGNLNSYQFVDKVNNLSGTRFYRLKLVQTGGTITYSAAIRLDIDGLGMKVVPNPFDKSLNLQLNLKSKQTVRIRLLDFSGREVYSTTEQVDAGNQSISLALPASLVKGMYVLDVSTASNSHLFQKKLVKQ